MHWGEVHHKTRMVGNPAGDFLARMCTDMITYQMNRSHGCSHLPVQMFQKDNAFLLPFAVMTLPIDLA